MQNNYNTAKCKKYKNKDEKEDAIVQIDMLEGEPLNKKEKWFAKLTDLSLKQQLSA